MSAVETTLSTVPQSIQTTANGAGTPDGGRMNPNTAYYETHYEELLDRHPEQWVAIYKQEVVGTASDARELLITLKQDGVPLNRVLVKHLTREEQVFILLA